MEVSAIDSPVQGEPTNEQSYADETSVPLRVLYQMLVDLYDNAYPIPFIDFRKTFDRYMKATKDNIIDTIVLLIYGAKDIKKIGTGSEDISIERLVEGRERYGEDVKTVRSPFYRFIAMDDELRIGYDYAVVIDYIDHGKEHGNDNNDQAMPELSEVVESNDIIKTRILSRFSTYINHDKGDIIFDFAENVLGMINVKDMKFVVKCKQPQYKLDDVTEIELQPLPKDCTGVRSVVINGARIIVTELDNGAQFCYNAEHGRFEIIEESGCAQHEYIMG